MRRHRMAVIICFAGALAALVACGQASVSGSHPGFGPAAGGLFVFAGLCVLSLTLLRVAPKTAQEKDREKSDAGSESTQDRSV